MSTGMCLRPIVTHEPLTDWLQISIRKFGRATGMFLAGIKTSRLSRLLFIRKTRCRARLGSQAGITAKVFRV